MSSLRPQVIVTTHRRMHSLLDHQTAVKWISDEWVRTTTEEHRTPIIQEAIDHFDNKGAYEDVCHRIWKKHSCS